MSKSGKPYEALIYKIYTELEPFADVRLNDYIDGHTSKTKREIDVSVRTNVAGSEILLIVQAKDYSRPAGLKTIGEFDSVIRDVEASKGILICSAGFTKQARDYAKTRKISLFSALDASSTNWKDEIQIPVIRSSYYFLFEIKCRFNEETPQPNDHDFEAFRKELEKFMLIKRNGSVTSLFEELILKWDKGEFNRSKGKHSINFLNEPLASELLGRTFTYRNLDFEYKLTTRNYFKYFNPLDYRGFKDYLNETFKATHLVFREKIPLLNDGTWQQVEKLDEISVKSNSIYVEQFDFLLETFVRMKYA